MILERSPDTIKRWHTENIYPATNVFKYGEKGWIWLYTDFDIKVMKEIAANIKPGPKKKTS